MQYALLALLTLVALPLVSAEQPVGGDGWSKAVNGLRGRFTSGEGRVFNGTRLPEVYLELHNASDIGNPMQFSFSVEKSLRFDLRTADGKPAPKPDYIMRGDGPVFMPFPILLPKDGILKFPVTWPHYAIRPNSGTMFCFEGPGIFWAIPRADQTDYFLTATLEVPETPRDPRKVRQWHGTISIPATKVPTVK